MSLANSPLRYPGGKQVIAPVLASLIRTNNLSGCAYAEPYAGGGGAALTLLFQEHVSRIALNDADGAVYSVWHSVLNDTERFLKLLKDTKVTISEWKKQKQIYSHPKRYGKLKLGFATFFLNRTNRSGVIMNAGPIGGYDQSGEWKIDARYNASDLARRVERIALYRDRIEIHNLDALDFISGISKRIERFFVYLDPPYYVKGSLLYLNHYVKEDHEKLAKYLSGKVSFPWVMSYDHVPQVSKLYRDRQSAPFELGYSVSKRKTGKELLIFCEQMTVPKSWARRIPMGSLSRASA